VDAQGQQLYFVGGNQRIEPEDLPEGTPDKRFVPLGEVHALSYTTEKSFDGFRSIPYAHRFGEEDGQRPSLVYDRESERLLLIGGGYSIAPPDAALGASPGIVN
jgi:hypothetical protein